MADTKFSDFNNDSAIAAGDYLVGVDISETDANKNTRWTWTVIKSQILTDWLLTQSTSQFAFTATAGDATIKTQCASSSFDAILNLTDGTSVAKILYHPSTDYLQLGPNGDQDAFRIYPTYFRMNQPVQMQSYTVAGVPAATTAARVIYVSDETGGGTLAFSDGTNWRRVQDYAIIS